MQEHAQYLACLKILLRKNDAFLILNTPSDHYDLPGGKINFNEYDTALAEIISREIKEELGGDIQYQLGGPLFQYQTFGNRTKRHILITVYEATYLAGEITLSPEHKSYQWLTQSELLANPSKFKTQAEHHSMMEYFLRDSLHIINHDSQGT